MRCRKVLFLIPLLLLLVLQDGCRSPTEHREDADSVSYDIIKKKQEETLGKSGSFSIDRPGDLLRRRLLEEQDLPYSSDASLGTDQLQPIDHWPEESYPALPSSPDAAVKLEADQPLKISLVEALQIGARNSPDYQSNKEEVFQSALSLDLERDAFRSIFTSQVEHLAQVDDTGDHTVTGTETGAAAGVSKTFDNGIDLTAELAVDLANLLTQGGASSLGVTADATVSIPLLRGAGKHIVTEPLIQAERDIVYAIYEFERFKRTFAVDIATDYFSVLRQMDSVTNARENYSSAIASARWSRRRADAGRLREIEVDQAVQRELSARNNWISSRARLENQLDTFKNSIGLPTDARIELDRAELEQLRASTEEITVAFLEDAQETALRATGPADAEIVIEPPSDEDAGSLEIDETTAIRLAFENRLDMRIMKGSVYDSQRQVVVAADALGAELTLLGSAAYGEGRSIGSAGQDNANLNLSEGWYSALISMDLPIERTAERNAYRNSLINLERAARSLQSLEEQIKLSIRSELRSLLESREALKIQAQSVTVAEKRVRSSTVFLEAGRIEIRDLLDAQDSLLQAQNSLTAAVINYRIAELEIQRDMGLLEVDEQGLWREFNPEDIDHDSE